MKLLREISRIAKQFISFPINFGNYIFGTFYYDNFLSKSKKTYSGHISLNERVVIFLIFPEKGITKSHLRSLNHFIKNNYSPLVICNLPLSTQDQKEILSNCWTLIERKNYGYDFGGYREGILFLNEKLKKLDNLILINDSTWFPISHDNTYFDFIENSNLDFIGATSHYGFPRLQLPTKREDLTKPLNFNSRNRRFHYASYALSFSNKILKDNSFFNFWKKLRLSGTKNIIVRRGEVGITQYVLKNKNYSHGSLIDSRQLKNILKNLPKEILIKIAQESIIENTSLKKFKNKFLRNLEDFSKDEVTAFIIILVSRQIIVFSLIKFLIEELNFPFLKKMLLKLDEESAYSTYEIIKKLDHEIFDEINSEIKENRLLRGFISVS